MAQEISVSLRNNLAAIAQKNRVLAERLCWPVEGSHIQFEEDGTPVYCVQSNRHPFVMSDDFLSERKREISEDESLFLFGIGLGEGVSYYLKNTTIDKVVVWDRDPWLFRLALEKNDFSESISSGRLEFLLGSDILAALPTVGSAQRVSGTFFEKNYANELDLLTEGVHDKRALVCSGTLFVDDLADALRAQGYSIYTWDLQRLSEEELMLTGEVFKPTLVAAINYTYGLVEACTALRCPLLCWEIDPAIEQVRSPQGSTEGSHIFTYREKNVDEFLGAGFSNVEYLPLASNTQKRNSLSLSEDDRDRYGAGVSFVGSSMASHAEVLWKQFWALYEGFSQGSSEMIAGAKLALNSFLSEQRKDFSRYIIADLFVDGFSEFIEWVRNQGLPQNLSRLVAETSASEKRISYLAALGKYSVHAWGDLGFKSVDDAGGVYRGLAGHHVELNKIYGSSQINIDINRIYQPDIVTMRIFDVLSCGGFILAEHNKALADIFLIGEELDTYRTLDDLLEKVAFYIENPQKAQEIAQKGRERVQKDHTIQARVEFMLDRMAKSRGNP